LVFLKAPPCQAFGVFKKSLHRRLLKKTKKPLIDSAHCVTGYQKGLSKAAFSA
jgi:hypothetical protein